MKPIRLILLLCLFPTLLPGASEMRTFTDAQGRSMEARINRVSGNDVYIERKDGLATRVDIAVFSKADQDFIRDWSRKQKLTSGILEVQLSKRERNKSRWEDGRGTGIEERTWEGYYVVTIRNTGTIPVKNVRVEYLAKKFSEEVAATKRNDGKARRKKGEAKVDAIPPGREHSFETEPFDMRATRLKGNYYFENGGDRESEDELDGIWVRIYSGDLLIHEESRPILMSEKETW